MKILLIDDSKFMRLANQSALTRAGYEVIGVADGELGLQAARDQQPDLILLDMLLPKVSGPEVLKALKSAACTREIPVIVLTSLSQKNEAKLLSDGAVAFVIKSDELLANNSSALIQTVGDIFRRCRSE